MNSEMTGLNQFFWITLELTPTVIESGVRFRLENSSKTCFSRNAGKTHRLVAGQIPAVDDG